MDANEDSIRVGGWILTPDPDARTRNAGTKLEQAEQLRRFAESRFHRAMVALHDDAQRKAPPHLAALESNPGMAISTRTGELVTRMGFEAAVAHIAVVQGVPAWTAERSLNRAEALAADLPEVLEALSTGRIGTTHVEVIADQTLRITPRAIPAPDETDPAAVDTWFRSVAAEERAVKASRNELGRKLLDYADGQNPAAVRAKAKRLLEKYDPESFSKRSRRGIDGRFFRIDPGSDGMAYLTVLLEAAKAEAIYDRVHQHAEALKNGAEGDGGGDDGGDDGGEAPESRTLDQLRTDVFSDQMLAGPYGSGLENVQAHVTVTVPATLLPGLGDARPVAAGSATAGSSPSASAPGGPATRASNVGQLLLPPGSDVPTVQRLGAIDQDSAATLMSNAPSWWRILTDPFDGAIIDWAHERYNPTPAQRRALAQRDHTCRTPGCNRQAARCEPDHTIEWQDGGTTDLGNLALLCKRCHRLKSLGILTMAQLPNGTMVVSTLWGTTRQSVPEAAWAPQTVAARAPVDPSATCQTKDRASSRGQVESEDGRGPRPAEQSWDPEESWPAEQSWDPWEEPTPHPPPDVVDRLNAELFAWADENLEWPPDDAASAAASWLDSQEAARSREPDDAQRQADSDAYDAAGGEDNAWLLAELRLIDHTPDGDPGKPRRRYPCAEEPTRPRVHAMKKRRPLSINGIRDLDSDEFAARRGCTPTADAVDPFAAWTAPTPPGYTEGGPPPF